MSPVIVWRPDPRQYAADASYAQRVNAFVHQHLPLCSPFDAEVRQSDDGERALAALSFFTRAGEWNYNANGQVTQTEHLAHLPQGAELP